MRGDLSTSGIEVLVRRQMDNGRSARFGILKRREESIVCRLIDDRGVVWAVDIRITGCDKPLGMRDELLGLGFGQKDVIDGNAHLTGVDALGPELPADASSLLA